MPELTCPVCGGVLHREERSLRCGAGHCYDIARQGYVNLLRSNQSKTKRHGDDQRMVAVQLCDILDGATRQTRQHRNDRLPAGRAGRQPLL